MCNQAANPLYDLSPAGVGSLPGLAAAVPDLAWPGLSGLAPGLTPHLDCAVCLVTTSYY